MFNYHYQYSQLENNQTNHKSDIDSVLVEEASILYFEDGASLSQQKIHSNLNYCQQPIKRPRKKRKKQLDFFKKRSRKPIQKKISQSPPQQTFSLQEDQLLLQLIHQLGPKFKLILPFFPTRTLNMIKNRFYKQLRFRWDEVLGKQYCHLNAEHSPKPSKSLIYNSFEEDKELTQQNDEEGLQASKSYSIQEQSLCFSDWFV